MNIDKQNLIVTIDGVQTTTPLPSLPIAADVKVWIVPKEYRDNSVFVAVMQPGDPEELPSCDLSECVYLGEIGLPAENLATLAALKLSKYLEINDACNAAVASLAASYPEREIQSWPQQVKEAEALAADPQASAPLLTAIADARGLPVVELASRVIGKMNAYAAASGSLIGRRQAAEDMIDLAATAEDVAGIVW